MTTFLSYFPSPTFSLLFAHPPTPTLFPYTTLFRSNKIFRIRFFDSYPDNLKSKIQKRPRRRKWARSEEHTSELQSLTNLVCRLLLEKKKKVKSHSVCKSVKG